jgi:hypothetical protein
LIPAIFAELENQPDAGAVRLGIEYGRAEMAIVEQGDTIAVDD